MALLSQVGIPGGGGNLILHPKHRNRWQAQFLGMTNTVGGTNPADARNLTAQLTTFTRPSLEFDEVTLDRYNSRAYVAGKHTWSPITFNVEDDIGGLASSVLQAQLETQQRLIGAFGNNGQWLNTAMSALEYKFGTIIQMLDGNETVLEEWSLEGCWLSAVDYSDLDYADGAQVVISVTMRFDHARQFLTTAGAGLAVGGFVNDALLPSQSIA